MVCDKKSASPSKRLIDVKVHPRANKEFIEWAEEGVLNAYVNAPPVDGKANAALIRLIAEFLDVPKSRVEVVKGLKSRNKLVAVYDR